MITMAQWLWVYTDYISWCLKNALKVINHSLTHREQISKQAWFTNYGCNQETFSCTTFWTPLSLVFLWSCFFKMCVLCVMIKFKTRSTTWKHYAIIACNRRFWITITNGIYIYADFGKDKNTNDNDLLTYSISSQLYSKGGLFDFKMLTLDLNHIANNPLCNMSTKNRTDIRPFPFKKMQCKTSSSALITV